MSKKTVATLTCILGLMGSPSRAEGVFTFGIGSASCATVSSDRQREAEVQIWIQGAWSALNIGNHRNRRVGQYSDGASVMQAIKAVCQKDPGLQLANALVTVYADFERLGR